MLKRIIDWLLPLCCIVCERKFVSYVCSSCLSELPWLGKVCLRCAKPLPTTIAGNTCGECLIDPPPYNQLIGLFRYEFPIVSLVTQLKFRKQLWLAHALGQLMRDYILEQYRGDILPQCIIPVPLHATRLRERGYNQALELAKPFRKLGIPVDFRFAIRKIATVPQTLLEQQQRGDNVKNAFSLSGKRNYQHVAVLDDVVTTGSTVVEVTKVLRASGVARIDVWCLARA